MGGLREEREGEEMGSAGPPRGGVRGRRQGQVTTHCCKREPHVAERVTGPGSPLMRPKTLPNSECDSGKAPRGLNHQRSAESRHAPPALRVARPRFLGDGVLADRE